MNAVDEAVVLHEPLQYGTTAYDTTVSMHWLEGEPYVGFRQDPYECGDKDDVVCMSKVDFLRIANMIRGH